MYLIHFLNHKIIFLKNVISSSTSFSLKIYIKFFYIVFKNIPLHTKQYELNASLVIKAHPYFLSSLNIHLSLQV